MEACINKDKVIDDLLLLIAKKNNRIAELERERAGVRVSLIAMRTAVRKGGSVSEEQLKDLIDELEAK